MNVSIKTIADVNAVLKITMDKHGNYSNFLRDVIVHVFGNMLNDEKRLVPSDIACEFEIIFRSGNLNPKFLPRSIVNPFESMFGLM